MASSEGRRIPGRAKVADAVLVMLLVVASVASLVLVSRASAGEKGSLAIIEVNGKEVKRVALGDGQKTRTVTVRGVNGPSTIEFGRGRVRMLESRCRDRICVRRGWIDSRGDTIVCLPNRVVIRVTGKRGTGGGGLVDSVTE